MVDIYISRGKDKAIAVGSKEGSSDVQFRPIDTRHSVAWACDACDGCL